MRASNTVMVAMAVLLAATSATGAIHNVTVAPGGSFAFSPSDITVAAGDTVHWTWDATGHNVASGAPGSPTPYFYSGSPAAAGTTFDVVFDMVFVIANPVPGNVYDYFCEPHGSFGMVGSVEVTITTGLPADPESWGSIKAMYR